LQKTLGTYQEKQKANTGKEPGEKHEATDKTPVVFNLSNILHDADRRLSYPGDYTIKFPQDARSPLSITKNKVGFFAPAAGDKLTVSFDKGEILKIEIFKDKPFNQRVAGSIKALHTGSVYGMFTKILYFLACLVATTLPITGTIIWINKLNKRRKRPASFGVPKPQPSLYQDQEIM
jgi:uncharacterized iron-regulated membrane protein